MFSKKIETKAAIHELIASRWSGRAYNSNKTVTREQIISLLEAARWAPSCYGDQPWRFIVFDKSTNESAWEQALDCLAEGNRAWAKDAPLLLLSCADSILSKNGKWYSDSNFIKHLPGTHYEYSNAGSALLGYIIEQVTGENLKSYTQKYIIDPLQMRSSTWTLEQVDQKLHTTYYLENKALPMPALAKDTKVIITTSR